MIKPTKNTYATMPTSELLDEELSLAESHKAELTALYDDFGTKFQVGRVVKGKVIGKENNGVLISIDYKSDGLVPNFEFSEHELKKISNNEEIDVMLDRLEDENGTVVLSYQKAKALKAWEKIAQLAEADEPVRGFVTHKVKGGLSVDIGIPAFLPGSQVDTQRVTNFDQFDEGDAPVSFILFILQICNYLLLLLQPASDWNPDLEK